MTAILGITDGDDGGAALVIDGKLVAAVNEERLNRMKMSIGFPRLAAMKVLDIAGIGVVDVDHIAMASEVELLEREAKPNNGWFAKSTGISRIRNEVSSALSKPLSNFPFAMSAAYPP